ncbi:MAG: TIR domain-containing protein, partial [Verrucomicrobia bacterium]|nr:TIR domain-containing protein [Verrucomicrobiota bacterium]
MSDFTMKHVFISHASADATKAAALCKALEDRGFRCWIAPRDIDPGKQYGEEIIRGIEHADGMVLMLSAKSNTSPHVRDEAERAKHYGKRLIPFRIEDITPSKSLEFYVATSQWIDAHGAKWGEGVDRLAAAISKMEGQAPLSNTAAKPASSGRKSARWVAAACLAVALIGISAWAIRHAGSSEAGHTAAAALHTNAGNADATVINLGGERLPVPKAGIHPNDSELVPRYHALVIGINAYTDYGTQGWDNLNTAANDAREVAKILNQQYGFDVTQLLDESATRANIMQQLDTIATSYPDQAILIYYAGHGFYKEEVDQGYWIPSDARRITPEGRDAKQDWIWNSTLQEMLNTTPSKHVLVIADSCFSGSLFRGSAEEALKAHDAQWYRRAIKKDSRYLITSGGLEPVLDGGGAGH